MRRLFVLAAALLLSTAAEAKEYVFSLSWEPAFCATHANASECKVISAQSFDGNNMVLHGLWPQGGEYCNVPAAQVSADKEHRWQDLAPVEVSAATRARMGTYFPGAASLLDRHEWTRHGVCSGMSPDAYFQTAMDMVEQAAKSSLGALITANVGKSVDLDQVCDSLIRDFGGRAAKAATVRQANGGLSEVRFTMDDKAGALSLSAAYLAPGKKALSCTGTMSIGAPKGL